MSVRYDLGAILLKNIYSIVVLAFTSVTLAAPLKVGYIDAPPFSYMSKAGKAAGLLPAIANKTFSKLSLKHRFEFLPVARVYKNIKDGTLDLYNCGTNEMPNTFRGQKVLLYMDLGIFSRKDAKDIKTLEDLRGEDIALFLGASASGIQKLITDTKSGTLFHELNSIDNMISFVKKRRANHLLLYKRMFPDYKLKGFKYTSLKRVDCRWIISNKIPDAKEILRLLDEKS